MVKSKHLSSQDDDVRANTPNSLSMLSLEERGLITGEDRISNLPQPLIHHILSKLPAIDAMRTMVLSKAWKDEWLTSPFLEFATEKLDRFEPDTQPGNKFLNFAFRVLTRRSDLNCSSIESLHLFFPSPPESRRTRNGNQEDELLRYAVTKYVIHELKLSSYSKSRKYKLSKDIIQYAHSLLFLELKCLKLDQQTIAIIAINCPLLKSLDLKFCDFTDLKIRVWGFHKLVNLNVIGTTTKGDDVKVEIIDAPILEKFRYFGLSPDRAVSPSIDVISDSACKELMHMDLINVWFDRNSLNRVLSHLPNLQHLKLSCYFLCYQRLDICSPSLKYLELMLQNMLVQLHIDAPNLTDFVYTFRVWTAMPIIFPFNADSFNPKKVSVNIDICCKELEGLLQDVQFNQFLRPLDGFSRHLMARITIFYRDTLPCLRGLHSSVFDFEHVVLIFDVWSVHSLPAETSQIIFTTILDPALCFFRNLQTCIILQHNFGGQLVELKLEFKYEVSGIHNCWQERLREVNIDSNRGSEMYLSPLKSQFEEAIKANKSAIQC